MRINRRYFWCQAMSWQKSRIHSSSNKIDEWRCDEMRQMAFIKKIDQKNEMLSCRKEVGGETMTQFKCYG